jgi:hypothetical protein
MNQPSLFHEDIWQALSDCVRALGGAKKVGAKLRPEIDPLDAGRWLLDCLNSARKEKLCLEQVLLILREARAISCHAGMAFIAKDAGYTEPQPAEPEDEYAQLQRVFSESVKAQGSIVARMEMLAKRIGPNR